MNHPLVQLQHLDIPEVFNVRRLHVGLVLDGVPIDQHGAPTGAQQDLGGPLHERIAHQLPIFWIYFVHTFHLHLPSVYLSRDSSLNYHDPLKYCSLFLCSSNVLKFYCNLFCTYVKKYFYQLKSIINCILCTYFRNSNMYIISGHHEKLLRFRRIKS